MEERDRFVFECLQRRPLATESDQCESVARDQLWATNSHLTSDHRLIQRAAKSKVAIDWRCDGGQHRTVSHSSHASLTLVLRNVCYDAEGVK
jgi:RNase adaptor protein for sRNA GlmZ degradation